MNRKQRAELAQETLSIIEQGFYMKPDNGRVDIQADLDRCKRGTVLYKEGDLNALKVTGPDTGHGDGITIKVTDETTLGAVRREHDRMASRNVVCLNFASAVNPGGTFLSGTQAQEESLARSSGLYASIADQSSYYDYHRKLGSALYTDRMIYSPDVPVFRDDAGRLLNRCYFVSVITSPAINTGALRENEPEKIDEIERTMRHRMEKVLWLAAYHKADVLILGAWGCGVFKNDPRQIAGLWYEHLVGVNTFNGRFDKVVFAVPNNSSGNYQAFVELFGR